MVTDWNPLTIWYYRRSYVRFPAHDYSTADLKNNYSHLANNSVAKDADSKKTMLDIEGNMMFIEDF